MKRTAPLAGLLLALLVAAASLALSATGNSPRPASTKRGAFRTSVCAGPQNTVQMSKTGANTAAGSSKFGSRSTSEIR